MNVLKKLKKDKKGFTLVELIVVIVILGILLAILVPGIMKWIDKAKNTQIQVDARTAYLAASTYLTEEYGKKDPGVQMDGPTLDLEIKKDTSIGDSYSGSITAVTYVETDASKKGTLAYYTIKTMEYTDANGKKATLDNGKWTVQ